MLLYILCHIISIILYHVHISILYQLYRLCQYIISIITIILIIPIIFLTLVVSCFSGVILVGGGGQDGGYDALDYRKIKNGNAGPLGNYAILSVLPLWWRLWWRLWVADRHGLSSPKSIICWDWMRWSEEQHVSVFYCTGQYIFVNSSRTCFSRCVHINAHRGSHQ